VGQGGTSCVRLQCVATSWDTSGLNPLFSISYNTDACAAATVLCLITDVLVPIFSFI